MYAIQSHTSESYKAMMAKRKLNETYCSNLRAWVKSAHVPEAVRKAVSTRVANGSQQRSQKAATAARSKAVTTRKQNATQFTCIALDGTSCTGANSDINAFIRRKGYPVHVDGYLSRISNGSLPNPFLAVRGALKGFKFLMK